jgi:hypothetical protein
MDLPMLWLQLTNTKLVRERGRFNEYHVKEFLQVLNLAPVITIKDKCGLSVRKLVQLDYDTFKEFITESKLYYLSLYTNGKVILDVLSISTGHNFASHINIFWNNTKKLFEVKPVQSSNSKPEKSKPKIIGDVYSNLLNDLSKQNHNTKVNKLQTLGLNSIGNTPWADVSDDE